jgi:hypothetical protein
VKHRTDSNAPVNAGTDEIPDCSCDLFKGHCATTLITKKKNERVVITVFATADQIMSLCDNFFMNLFYFNSHALQ